MVPRRPVSPWVPIRSSSSGDGLDVAGFCGGDDQQWGDDDGQRDVCPAGRFPDRDDQSAGRDRRRGAMAADRHDALAEQRFHGDRIPVGSYTVEFKSVTGWTSPASAAVTITNGATTTASGTYVQQVGSLTVTISPQGAIDAGAQWRRIGTTPWLNSGATEPDPRGLLYGRVQVGDGLDAPPLWA